MKKNIEFDELQKLIREAERQKNIPWILPILQEAQDNANFRTKLKEITKKNDNGSISSMPTGTAIHSIQEIITSGGREGIENLPAQKEQINHGAKP